MKENDLQSRIAELEALCAERISAMAADGTHVKPALAGHAPTRVAGCDLAYLSALEEYCEALGKASKKIKAQTARESARVGRIDAMVESITGPAAASPAPAPAPAATAPTPQIVIVNAASSELNGAELGALTWKERLKLAGGQLSVADCRKILKLRATSLTDRVLAANKVSTLSELRAKKSMTHDPLD
jgi:hypothetical protein